MMFAMAISGCRIPDSPQRNHTTILTTVAGKSGRFQPLLNAINLLTTLVPGPTVQTVAYPFFLI